MEHFFFSVNHTVLHDFMFLDLFKINLIMKSKEKAKFKTFKDTFICSTFIHYIFLNLSFNELLEIQLIRNNEKNYL